MSPGKNYYVTVRQVGLISTQSTQRKAYTLDFLQHTYANKSYKSNPNAWRKTAAMDID